MFLIGLLEYSLCYCGKFIEMCFLNVLIFWEEIICYVVNYIMNVYVLLLNMYKYFYRVIFIWCSDNLIWSNILFIDCWFNILLIFIF